MRRSVTISVNDELLKLVDDYCAEMFITRSQAFTMAFVQMQQQRAAIRSLEQATVVLQQVIDKGGLSDDDIAVVKNLEKAMAFCVR